ncbi:NAD(P)-binding protein [Choiromyces venosus 120613-1]|uniref:NAD(P)-binding protein n=1 Tax=Choiromyces venosus 120613-1 TaxID=1336337 RepID=A0A3N4K3M0_9PEZI|nr:NAD(P)-binding protein [Choiromyces venosus 120613-1]
MDVPTEKDWQDAFNIDLMAHIHLIGMALPYLEKSSNASALMMSSIAGRDVVVSPGYQFWSCGTFKAALLHYTLEQAQVLRPKGIRVNCLTPGVIFAKDGPWDIWSKEKPEMIKAMLAGVPMGRFGSAKEVADVGVFLASKPSAYVSGGSPDHWSISQGKPGVRIV